MEPKCFFGSERQPMKDAEQDKLLKSATQWQTKPKLTCHRAGQDAAMFLSRHQRGYAKNAALVDAWDSLIPQGLRPYCRLDGRTGNVLTIQAAPGPYLHQIQMMQKELLAELGRLCPSAGIQKIRIIPLKDNGRE